jgi:hypothetical protein
MIWRIPEKLRRELAGLDSLAVYSNISRIAMNWAFCWSVDRFYLQLLASVWMDNWKRLQAHYSSRLHIRNLLQGIKRWIKHQNSLQQETSKSECDLYSLWRRTASNASTRSNRHVECRLLIWFTSVSRPWGNYTLQWHGQPWVQRSTVFCNLVRYCRPIATRTYQCRLASHLRYSVFQRKKSVGESSQDTVCRRNCFILHTQPDQKNLHDRYPLSYKKLVAKVKEQRASARPTEIQRVIKQHNLKKNKKYADYVFTNKEHEERYNSSDEPGNNDDI